MDVVITNLHDRLETRWSYQFIGEQGMRAAWPAEKALFDGRRRHGQPVLHPTWKDIIAALKTAAALAGANGTVILATGHAGATPQCVAGTAGCDPTVGRVTFDQFSTLVIDQSVAFYKTTPPGSGGAKFPSAAEKDQHRIEQAEALNTAKGKEAFIKSLTDKKQAPAAIKDALEAAAKATKRKARRAIYEAIGAAMAKPKLKRIVLLSCAVGSATKFIDQLARDWGVQVAAYRQRVAFEDDDKNKVRAHLLTDTDGVGTNIPRAEIAPPNATDPKVGYIGLPHFLVQAKLSPIFLPEWYDGL
jgi:hypothetical protein